MTTVKELKEHLAGIPDDALVCVDIWHDEGYHTHIVHTPACNAPRPYQHEGKTYWPILFADDCRAHRLDLQDGRRRSKS